MPAQEPRESGNDDRSEPTSGVERVARQCRRLPNPHCSYRFERLGVPWVRFVARQVFSTALAVGTETTRVTTTIPRVAAPKHVYDYSAVARDAVQPLVANDRAR
jgi:hypothetical protein